MKKIDTKLIEESIKNILVAIGENPDREGLMETPKRVANMYKEVFEGNLYTNKEIAEMFGKTFTSNTNDLVIIKDIPSFSYCEHHLALMYNMKVSVAYIPNGKVLGLSKIVRMIDMASKRLQIQERLTKDIAEIILLASGSNSLYVLIESDHSCITTRGIKKEGEKTITSHYTGQFKTDKSLKLEFLNSLGR